MKILNKTYDDLVILGWVASSFSLVGTLLNAFQIIWCWPIWLAGNFFWMYWSFKKREWSQLVLWTAFQVGNMIGWYQWSIM